MRTYTGTQHAESGLYFNSQRRTVTTLDKDGPLPGTADDRYRRLPMIVMLALAPLFGLAFVIFLPFIGFVMVAHLLGHKAFAFATEVATEAARVLEPNWAPARAFLSRNRPAKKEEPVNPPADAESDTWVEDVKKTLNENDSHR